MKNVLFAILAVWLFNSPIVATAFAGNACEGEMIEASKRYDIPLGILYAVGLTETGNKDSLQPYALNIDGKAVFAQNESQALRIFYEAKRRGAKLIDVGCMQINHYYHGERFPSVAAMFQPHLNVDYAARFLKELRQREGSWTMAVARYHAGPNNNPAQKRYVCQVMANMIASGFGKWTQASRQFCRGEL
ncbi:transglycosylase SLT domain-containing protein [Bartonella choladocola]|uniref:Transglycosylase SLT domain-containing protein n=1 Tax=Bartonella choladocola TaxID=2750995 RepID=A0A1U9MG27_9HYPH|nr:transglycosylase SLT domain-containing protein [Bartonella choladocola]AQT46678.1 Transglycosylase SLT domain-containing protein [Bartonella choladocola]MBI0140037.1 transglycosylase SLT domain-containing protein [Bartonella choladocola]